MVSSERHCLSVMAGFSTSWPLLTDLDRYNELRIEANRELVSSAFSLRQAGQLGCTLPWTIWEMTLVNCIAKVALSQPGLIGLHCGSF